MLSSAPPPPIYHNAQQYTNPTRRKTYETLNSSLVHRQHSSTLRNKQQYNVESCCKKWAGLLLIIRWSWVRVRLPTEYNIGHYSWGKNIDIEAL